jgi:signal transduction histidine kinase
MAKPVQRPSDAVSAFERFRLWTRRVWPPGLGVLRTETEALRIERVIAFARLLLTAIALLSIDFNPIQSIGSAPAAYVLLVLFAAHSVSALFVLRRRQKTTRAFSLTTHTIDLFAAVLTLPAAGGSNAFFTFFLFVLAAAAFRWGFRETIITTLAALALVMLHVEIASARPMLSLTGSPNFQLVMVRAAYLSVMGLLLALLVEEGHLLRSEMTVVVRLLQAIRIDAGLTRAFHAVAQRILELFDASNVMLVIENLESRRLFRWDLNGGWSIGPVAAAAGSPGAERRAFLFGPADRSISIRRRRSPWRRDSMSVHVLDASGGRMRRANWEVPAEFVAAYPFRRVIGTPINFGEEWEGRAYVFDPSVGVRLGALARFLQTVVRQVGPALFSVYLLGELRTRAGAMERARVARELHDGVIQSLIGVEMQLQVLRGRDVLGGSPVLADLEALQTTIRSEVVSLRELLQQMRPPDFDPDELLDYLADMVQRFGRDTGITARFSTDVREVMLPRRVCFELVRIVQEGLANVRKHSGASHVLVRFGVAADHWTLEIDDDGRGFPFAGRLQHADLDARRSGPVIIKERVRAIGGQLAVHSEPGRGTRLEVLVPQAARG